MTARDRVRNLAIWSGPVEPEPLDGGITNVNFKVRDGARTVVVRIGSDIPVHHVLRFNELAASRAAHAAGISPAVLHHEPGVLVIDWVDGHTLTAAAVRAPAMLARVLALIARSHRDLPGHLRGASLAFHPFHIIRDYAATLRDGHSPHAHSLPALLRTAHRLEQAVGPDTLVYGHNDLLPANILDDGRRLWLIDWDYAGWSSPLFDLGGLAANNQLAPGQEHWLLEAYFQSPATPALLHRYHAMKATAALRETLWSMVSERHSDLPVDFAAYTRANLAAFHAALETFSQT